MAKLIEIQRVEIGLENLTARVRIAPEAPLFTSEDLQGTTRIYNLMPHIIDHVCLGDAGETFKDCMGNTELAHLLEHVTVELLAQTNVAGDVTTGRTYPVEGEERGFDIELSCQDDVLTVGALSSAAWIIDWAFTGGEDASPDVDAIVSGLCGMIDSMGDDPADAYERSVMEELDAEAADQHQRALEERQREIAQREQEIEAARQEAERLAEEKRFRLEQERLRKEEAARLAREAAERAEAEEAARVAREQAEREAAERERERRAEEERLVAEAHRAAAALAASEAAAAERAAAGLNGASSSDPTISPEAYQSAHDEPLKAFPTDLVRASAPADHTASIPVDATAALGASETTALEVVDAGETSVMAPVDVDVEASTEAVPEEAPEEPTDEPVTVEAAPEEDVAAGVGSDSAAEPEPVAEDGADEAEKGEPFSAEETTVMDATLIVAGTQEADADGPDEDAAEDVPVEDEDIVDDPVADEAVVGADAIAEDGSDEGAGASTDGFDDDLSEEGDQEDVPSDDYGQSSLFDVPVEEEEHIPGPRRVR